MAWLRSWRPAIGWAATIWIFSTELFSSQSTAWLLFPLLHWLLPNASATTLMLWHIRIRKSAHLAEFFIFSLLVLRGIRGGRAGWRLTWGLASVAIAADYAALDEVHQAFVPTRGASALDALLDSLGAAIAQAFAWWRSSRVVKISQRLSI